MLYVPPAPPVSLACVRFRSHTHTQDEPLVLWPPDFMRLGNAALGSITSAHVLNIPRLVDGSNDQIVLTCASVRSMFYNKFAPTLLQWLLRPFYDHGLRHYAAVVNRVVIPVEEKKKQLEGEAAAFKRDWDDFHRAFGYQSSQSSLETRLFAPVEVTARAAPAYQQLSNPASNILAPYLPKASAVLTASTAGEEREVAPSPASSSTSVLTSEGGTADALAFVKEPGAALREARKAAAVDDDDKDTDRGAQENAPATDAMDVVVAEEENGDAGDTDPLDAPIQFQILASALTDKKIASVTAPAAAAAVKTGGSDEDGAAAGSDDDDAADEDYIDATAEKAASAEEEEEDEEKEERPAARPRKQRTKSRNNNNKKASASTLTWSFNAKKRKTPPAPTTKIAQRQSPAKRVKK